MTSARAWPCSQRGGRLLRGSFPPTGLGALYKLASRFTQRHFRCILCIMSVSPRSTQTHGLWNQVVPLDRRRVKSQNLSWSAYPYVRETSALLWYVILMWVVDSACPGQALASPPSSPCRRPRCLMWLTLEFVEMLEASLFKCFQPSSPKP